MGVGTRGFVEIYQRRTVAQSLQTEAKWDPTGVYGSAESLATNQEVAGSSPAERAPKGPANVGLLFFRMNAEPGG